MEQGVLSYQYERDKSEAGMMALGGLPIYLDMAWVIGLKRSIGEHLGVRQFKLLSKFLSSKYATSFMANERELWQQRNSASPPSEECP